MRSVAPRAGATNDAAQPALAGVPAPIALGIPVSRKTISHAPFGKAKHTRNLSESAADLA
jgi:hypothetical protein